MSYPVVNPPYTPNFAKMSKGELTDYYKWFVEGIPNKTAALVALMNRTAEFASWKADKTPMSLERLGHWFAQNVETRQRSDEEIKEIVARSPYPIEVPQVELSDRTLGISLGVAMYFAQVFLHQYSTVEWHHSLSNMKSVHYGQPVLVGFGKGQELNPVHLMIVLAYAIAARERDGSRLRELYDVWSRKVTGSSC